MDTNTLSCETNIGIDKCDEFFKVYLGKRCYQINLKKQTVRNSLGCFFGFHLRCCASYTFLLWIRSFKSLKYLTFASLFFSLPSVFLRLHT